MPTATVVQHVTCGHTWTMRTDDPVQCPGCHRPIRIADDVERGAIVFPAVEEAA